MAVSDFKEFASGHYKAVDKMFPSLATYMGVHEYDHELEDVSATSLKGIEEYYTNALKTLT